MEADHAPRHRPRRIVPRLRAARPQRSQAQALRPAGRRSDDPGTVTRLILPEGPRAASAAGRDGARIQGGLHQDRDHLHRHLDGGQRDAGRPRRALALPHRSRTAVQRDLDIVEYTDAQHNPMIPHTLVLEPGLVIYSVYNGYWYWGRPAPAALRAAR